MYLNFRIAALTINSTLINVKCKMAQERLSVTVREVLCLDSKIRHEEYIILTQFIAEEVRNPIIDTIATYKFQPIVLRQNLTEVSDLLFWANRRYTETAGSLLAPNNKHCNN